MTTPRRHISLSPVRSTLHLLAGFLLVSAVSSARPIFIGTQMGGNSTAKGIYRADFDPDTGNLTTPELAAEYRNPGFLVLHPKLPVLLTIGSPAQPFPDGSSSVAAFSINSSHQLKFLREAPTGGKGACHLAIDSAGRTVATANYNDGAISTIPLDETGAPTQPKSVVRNTGSGPNNARQNGPHAHGVYFDHAATRLFIPDLGLDKVLVYRFDAANSSLEDPLPALSTPPGAGPRHMTFSANQYHAYVINELDGTLLAASLKDDSWSPIGLYPTLPADFQGPNTAAEVELSPDERFLYASNRGHDCIAVFSRNPSTGAITFVQHAPCGGKTPRHFKISPCGRWLICAHLESNTISVLPRDPQSGKLGPPAHTVPSPAPICILFP